MTEAVNGLPLLEISDVAMHFPIRRGVMRRQVGTIRAVDGVSFDIQRGETLGLVGESGSGKSTLARAILRQLRPTGGSIRFDGQEITHLDRRSMRAVRPHMQMVFQDPHSSLNPRMTVGGAVLEALTVNGIGEEADRQERVRELFTQVGLDGQFINRHPHEMSGGQQQRVAIARALASQPDFIVADEAISSLDVSIQAQIVNLFLDLKTELGLTYLFVAHDLSMVRYVSDRIAVLYLGQVSELGSADDIWHRPLHPYTSGLLSAVTVPDPERQARRRKVVLKGEPPSPANPPSGCRFRTRCQFATDVCQLQTPVLRDLGRPDAPHLVACHHAEELSTQLSPASHGASL